MRFIPILMIAGAVALAACASPPKDEPLSPREQALQLDTQYEAVIVAVDSATDSPQLSQDIKNKIIVASRTATDAVHAFNKAALSCFRDPKTGIVGNAPDNAPGETCDTSLTSRLLTSAQGALGNATALLGAFGIKVKGV